jgi:hypothetical protein
MRVCACECVRKRARACACVCVFSLYLLKQRQFGVAQLVGIKPNYITAVQLQKHLTKNVMYTTHTALSQTIPRNSARRLLLCAYAARLTSECSKEEKPTEFYE